MFPERTADECQNLATNNVRARCSQYVTRGPICVEIWAQALRLQLLASANSSHARSLRSATVDGTEAGADCSPIFHLQTAQTSTSQVRAASVTNPRGHHTTGSLPCGQTLQHNTSGVFERTATKAHRYSLKERTRRDSDLDLCTAPQPMISAPPKIGCVSGLRE